MSPERFVDDVISSELQIGLIGVAFGVALSFGVTEYREWRTARRFRRSLAASLLVEVMSQADLCAMRGNFWNIASQGSGSVELKKARQDRPPKPTVFESTAASIGTLEAKDAASVIAFHGALDIIRARIDGWSGEREGYAIKGRDLADIASKWRTACFNGILAIRALTPVAKIRELPNDQATVDRLLKDLQTVADGGVVETSSPEES